MNCLNYVQIHTDSLEHFENILLIRVADFSVFLLSRQIFFMKSESYFTEKTTSIADRFCTSKSAPVRVTPKVYKN